MKNIRIGFIVRCLNEERWIGHCLQSIVDLQDHGIDPTILVIDNESSDDSLKVVKMFRDTCDVQTIKRNDYLPGTSLNLGMQFFSACNFEHVGIVSAHCTISALDGTTLSQHMADPKCFGVIGKQVPIYRGKRVKSRYVWENFCDTPMRNLKDESHDFQFFFHNAFSVIRTSTWKEIPFSADVTGKEDRVYAADQVANGNHFVYEPSFVCRHHWVERCATWSGVG
jgi:glycosyltransferase involved in cell wall biosynthesis